MPRRLSLFALSLLVTSVAITAPATADSPRPFKARVTARWDNVFAALPRTPIFGGAGLAHFAGNGQVTHLGKAEQAGSLTLEEPVGPGVFPGCGSVAMTTPDGDTLTFDFFGYLYAATGEGVGKFKFTGGTGRFANASGSGTFYALIDLSEPVAQDMTVILDGQIRY
jgi:hypothetical protein